MMEESKMKKYDNPFYPDAIFKIIALIIYTLFIFIIGVQCGKWDERQRNKLINVHIGELK